jgi:hypothetical protein
VRIPFVLTQSDFAAILDELDFLKDQLAWLPTRAEVRWIALRLTLGALAAIVAAALLLGRWDGEKRQRCGSAPGAQKRALLLPFSFPIAGHPIALKGSLAGTTVG